MKYEKFERGEQAILNKGFKTETIVTVVYQTRHRSLCLIKNGLCNSRSVNTEDLSKILNEGKSSE